MDNADVMHRNRLLGEYGILWLIYWWPICESEFPIIIIINSTGDLVYLLQGCVCVCVCVCVLARACKRERERERGEREHIDCIKITYHLIQCVFITMSSNKGSNTCWWTFNVYHLLCFLTKMAVDSRFMKKKKTLRYTKMPSRQKGISVRNTY